MSFVVDNRETELIVREEIPRMFIEQYKVSIDKKAISSNVFKSLSVAREKSKRVKVASDNFNDSFY